MEPECSSLSWSILISSYGVANSAGEPLNPEVIRWFEEHVGCSIYEQYGQTELGMVVCNYHTVQSIRHPGSMGQPLPGYRAVLLDEQFQEVGPTGYATSL